jgi:hypothetical protein
MSLIYFLGVDASRGYARSPPGICWHTLPDVEMILAGAAPSASIIVVAATVRATVRSNAESKMHPEARRSLAGGSNCFCRRNPHSNSTFQEPMAPRIHRNKVD